MYNTYGCFYDIVHVENAVRYGHLYLVKWFVCVLGIYDTSVASTAATYGKIDIIKWLNTKRLGK